MFPRSKKKSKSIYSSSGLGKESLLWARRVRSRRLYSPQQRRTPNQQPDQPIWKWLQLPIFTKFEKVQQASHKFRSPDSRWICSTSSWSLVQYSPQNWGSRIFTEECSQVRSTAIARRLTWKIQTIRLQRWPLPIIKKARCKMWNWNLAGCYCLTVQIKLDVGKKHLELHVLGHG